MMGLAAAPGFLGPLIILSAMGASIPIGTGLLLGALVFYIWEKPITGAPFWGPCCWDLLPHRPGLIQGRLGGIQEPVCALPRKVVSKVKSNT